MEKIHINDISRSIRNIQDEANPHEKDVNTKWKFPRHFICNLNSLNQIKKDQR